MARKVPSPLLCFWFCLWPAPEPIPTQPNQALFEPAHDATRVSPCGLDGTTISLDDPKVRQTLPLLKDLEQILKITIDGKSDLIQLAENYETQGLVDKIDSTIWSSGRVPDQFFLNDVELTSEELQEKLDAGVQAKDELKIQTSGLKSFLKKTLLSTQEGVDELQEEAIELSDKMLREGQLGLSELAVWAGDLAQMAANLQKLIHMFQIPVEDIKIGNLSFVEGMLKLQKFTTLIIGSLNEGKKVNISDILQFQMADLLTDLKNIFPSLIEHLDRKLN